MGGGRAHGPTASTLSRIKTCPAAAGHAGGAGTNSVGTVAIQQAVGHPARNQATRPEEISNRNPEAIETIHPHEVLRRPPLPSVKEQRDRPKPPPEGTRDGIDADHRAGCSTAGTCPATGRDPRPAWTTSWPGVFR